MAFSDGSVKWELMKISNAEQLNGLTAKQIAGNITVKNLDIFMGSFAVGSKNSGSYQTGTIPLPSGYTRAQCKYWVSAAPISFSNNGSCSVYPNYIDQSSGYLSNPGGGGKSGSGTGFYLIFALKK